MSVAHTAGRPILFGDAPVPVLSTRDVLPGHFDFRPFTFKTPSTLSRRQTSSSSGSLSEEEIEGLYDAVGIPICKYKSGYSESSDYALLCPYAAELSTKCLGSLSLEEYAKLSLEESQKIAEQCKADTCAELISGRYLKGVLGCFDKVCEKDEAAKKMLEQGIGTMIKIGGCGAGSSATTAATTTATAAATKTTGSANETLKASASAASKTEDDEEEETSSTEEEKEEPSPVQEENAGVRLAGGWKNGVLVGALVFGSLFSGLLV